MSGSWWVADAWNQSPVFLGSWVLWVIVSICLHELGHGIAAIRVGDDTPIRTGHMPFNPLVHMGKSALLCFAIFGFTWGLMPVDPSRFRGRYADAFVAAAGPFVNVILAALCIVGAALWIHFGGGVQPHIDKNVRYLLVVGAMINVMGVLFNLIPVPPLDGSRILANFVPAYERMLYQSRHGGAIGLIAFVALFLFGGKLWHVATAISGGAIRGLVNVLGSTP